MVRIVTILFLLSLVVDARIAPPKISGRRALTYDKKLHKLNLKISSIEKKLQKTNKKYVSLVKKRNNTQARIDKMELMLQEEKNSLIREHTKVRSSLRGAILAGMDENKSPAQLLALKVLIKKLKGQVANINDRRILNRQRENDLKGMKSNLRDLTTMEHQLIRRLEVLEKEKQVIAHQYVEVIEKKDLLAEKQSKNRVRKGKLKFNKGLFVSPVKKFEKIEENDGDLRFVFKENMHIYAPKKGKVIKVSFGSRLWRDSLIIDHGKNLKSIIYGEFSAIVREGDLVEQGKLIGYGTTLKKTKAEVNFGIRMGSKRVNAAKFVKYN